MSKTSLFIEFEDRDALYCLPSACERHQIKSEMYVKYNSGGTPTVEFTHHSFGRKLEAFLVEGIRIVAGQLPQFLKAIKEKKKNEDENKADDLNIIIIMLNIESFI